MTSSLNSVFHFGALATVVGGAALASQHGLVVLLAVLLFVIAVSSSLVLLDRAGFKNTPQFVLVLFSWWFCLGGLARMFALQTFDASSDLVVKRVVASMVVSAVGLVAFAVAASFAVRKLSSVSWRGAIGRDVAFLRYLTIGALLSQIGSVAAVSLFPSSVEVVGFLGGTQTNVWWVGVISAIARTLSPLAACIAVSLAFNMQLPNGERRQAATLAVLLCVLVAVPGVLSGWKAPLVELVASIMVGSAYRSQRVPIVALLIGIAGYVLVFEPTVRTARDRLLAQPASAVDGMAPLLGDALGDVLGGRVESAGVDERASGLLAPFRGLSELAGEITLRAGVFEGGGRYSTVTVGLKSAVPRVLLPEKPDLDVGQALAQDYGVDLDMVNIADVLTNISPSVPFDVISEFGVAAGVLTFVILGFLCVLFSVALLGADRDVSQHPATGWIAFFFWKLESNVGSLLAEVRDLSIVLLVCVVTAVLAAAVRRKYFSRVEA